MPNTGEAMEPTQAQQLLGVHKGASQQDIQAAYQQRAEALAQKLAAAPTEALKQKLASRQHQLQQAYQLLSRTGGGASATGATPPPGGLSHTKLADLPGAAPAGSVPELLQPGQWLAGRYQIKHKLGAGGMGAVYSAFDQNRQEDIAIKVMLPALTGSESARERFLNEARLSATLSHPNIVNVYDVQHDGELYFLTMELLQGQDLRQVMENRTLARSPFTVAEVQELMAPLASALDYAHETIVHRDIKPENIWLTDTGKVKIMDFGIARLQSTSQRTQTGAAMGTAYYMAPEQLKGQKDIDGRADQYALAVMCYELLAGEVPAGRIEPLRHLDKGIPKALSDAVDKALSPKPENRFANVADFTQALASKKGAGISLSLKPLGIAAGVLLLVGAIGFAATSGGLSNVWDSIKPVSKEELAQQKASVAQIEGQIRTLKQRLDNARRQLSSDVRDAERNNDSDYPQLAHWQTLTDNALFNGNTLAELEGQLAMAQSLLREEAIEAAHTAMSEVLTGYQTLWDEFTAAEDLYTAEREATTAKEQWQQAISAWDGVGDPEAAKNANDNFQQAGTEQLSGQFKNALALWKNAQGSYQKAAKEVNTQRLVGRLVAIPAGRFQMGSNDGYKWEQPVHSVSVSAFKMMEHEVTFAQWDACVAAGGCSHKPDDKGWGRGNRPVMNISYNDITEQFIPWLNKLTGKQWRLPSEAEWEYAARAGTNTLYSWGNSIGTNRANCLNCGSHWDKKQTAPVKSFAPNAYGLYDMHGNVWELTQDCWNGSYTGAPADGSVWQSGDCSYRVLRGGSWYSDPVRLRSANRSYNTSTIREITTGFRRGQATE